MVRHALGPLSLWNLTCISYPFISLDEKKTSEEVDAAKTGVAQAEETVVTEAASVAKKATDEAAALEAAAKEKAAQVEAAANKAAEEAKAKAEAGT